MQSEAVLRDLRSRYSLPVLCTYSHRLLMVLLFCLVAAVETPAAGRAYDHLNIIYCIVSKICPGCWGTISDISPSLSLLSSIEASFSPHCNDRDYSVGVEIGLEGLEPNTGLDSAPSLAARPCLRTCLRTSYYAPSGPSPPPCCNRCPAWYPAH